MFNPMHLPSTLINLSEKIVCTTIQAIQLLVKKWQPLFYCKFCFCSFFAEKKFCTLLGPREAQQSGGVRDFSENG
jgi:hypothetical protein